MARRRARTVEIPELPSIHEIAPGRVPFAPAAAAPSSAILLEEAHPYPARAIIRRPAPLRAREEHDPQCVCGDLWSNHLRDGRCRTLHGRRVCPCEKFEELD